MLWSKGIPESRLPCPLPRMPNLPQWGREWGPRKHLQTAIATCLSVNMVNWSTQRASPACFWPHGHSLHFCREEKFEEYGCLPNRVTQVEAPMPQSHHGEADPRGLSTHHRQASPALQKMKSFIKLSSPEQMCLDINIQKSPSVR